MICHTHILLVTDVALPPDNVFVLLPVKRKNDVLGELRIDALGEFCKLVLVRWATSGVVYDGSPFQHKKYLFTLEPDNT